MKRLVLAAVLFGAVIALGMYASRQKSAPVPLAESPAEGGARSEDEPSAAPVASARQTTLLAKRVEPNAVEATPRKPVSPDVSAIPDSKLVLNQTIESLISPQTSFEQRQGLWKRLSEAGLLDQALTELQHQVALNLDPVNWEARFTKAVGMSYWPAELNKGGEVIEQLRMLIQQQESEDQQPQFARTYLRLGEQYEKAGHADYAAQIWQRGASLFPSNPDLRQKASSAR